MLKFTNLRWIFAKSTFIAALLATLIVAFSLYMNYKATSNKLESNNQLVATYVQVQIEKYKSRLELIREFLHHHNFSELKLSGFTSLYYLDALGNVLDKKSIDKTDEIKKFIKINSESIKNNEIFISQLVYSKNLKPSVYLALRIDDDKESVGQKISSNTVFLCARVELSNFLKDTSSFNSGFIITDSHQNVLFSSQPEVVESGISVGNLIHVLSFDGVFSSNSVWLADSSSVGSGFFVRSFISKDELMNGYYIITALLLAIFFLFIYNIYLDKKLLKIGLIDQINYCFDLFNMENPSAYKFSDSSRNNDVFALQKQLAKLLINHKKIKDENAELEQRLSTMFSKSSIPMLMIDAFSAKIFKANQAALDFYQQKAISIAKMNLYMLANNSRINDPIALAENLQNCIKNQGNFIRAHHFINGEHKEVKIYPFIMRSERFCYDLLMILDSSSSPKGLEYLSMNNKIVENSFICYLNIILEDSKMIIKSSSKGLQRYLSTPSLNGRQLKSIVHPSSVQQLALLLSKVRELKAANNIQQVKTFETTLFMCQSDGNFSEFKVNFIISFAENSQICLNAHLAHMRSDLSYFEVQMPIDYQSIFQSAKEHIVVLDSELNFLSQNAAVKEIIGEKKNLSELIKSEYSYVLDEIKNGTKNASYAQIIDAQGCIRKCKFKYIRHKDAKGDINYCLYFQDDYYKPLLEEFLIFMHEKGENYESALCEFYEHYGLITPVMAQSGLGYLDTQAGFNQLKEILSKGLRGNNN